MTLMMCRSAEQHNVDAFEAELSARQLDPNPSDADARRIQDLKAKLQGAKARKLEAPGREEAANKVAGDARGKWEACAYSAWSPLC